MVLGFSTTLEMPTDHLLLLVKRFDKRPLRGGNGLLTSGSHFGAFLNWGVPHPPGPEVVETANLGLGNILQCAFDPDVERTLEVVTVPGLAL